MLDDTFLKRKKTVCEDAFTASYEWGGAPLLPLTLGTYMLLVKSGNRLVQGDSSNPLEDIAGWILVHSAQTQTIARAAIHAGKFSLLAEQFLTNLTESGGKLDDILPVANLITVQIGAIAETSTEDLPGTDGAAKKKRRNFGSLALQTLTR